MDLKKFLKTIKLHEQEISMALGIIILIIAGIFVFNYVRNLKNESSIGNGATTENQNQTHTVAKGETLWSISQIYYGKGSDWKQIADANNVTDARKIEIGQELTIPFTSPQPSAEAGSHTTEPSPSPAPQITDEAAATDSSITEDSYTVVKGDNLWDIAVRAYGDGYKWVDIAKANNLTNPNIIHRGNTFAIPR